MEVGRAVEGLGGGGPRAWERLAPASPTQDLALRGEARTTWKAGTLVRYCTIFP